MLADAHNSYHEVFEDDVLYFLHTSSNEYHWCKLGCELADSEKRD